MTDRSTEMENVKGSLRIGALRLRRETLRELDAGELKQAQGGPGATFKCITQKCTRGCGNTNRC